MILLSIPIVMWAYEIVFLAGVLVLIVAGLLIHYAFGSIYKGLEWFSNNWRDITLVRILLGCLVLCAKGLFWILLRVIILMFLLGAVVSFCEGRGFGDWPMVVVGIWGIMFIIADAVKDVKKFGMQMSAQVQNV